MNCFFLRQAPIQTPGPADNMSSTRYRQRGNNSNCGSGNHKTCYRWNEQGMQGCRGCNYAHVCLIVLQRDPPKGSILGATQTGLTSFSNHVFLVAMGLLYMRNAVDIAEYDGELRN